MMSATVALFVFRVSISFCKNVRFLAISFSMIENARWCVSMTSTILASDLLESFASLVFTVFVDLVCASASVEHLRRDLELMNVVQHCRNLVALRCVELILLCWSSSLLQALRTFDVLGFRLHLFCLLDRCGRDDLSNLVPETFDVPSSGGLIESILPFKSLFQRRAHNLGSLRFLCELWNLDIFLNSLELLLRHLFSVGQLESTSLFLNRI